MEAGISETSLHVYDTKGHHIPEEAAACLHSHRF
jgi:hypothetical protein